MQKTKIRAYVASLAEDVKLLIIKDYVSLENNGFIGDCLLRTHVNKLCDLHGKGSFVVDCALLAMAIYEEYYHSTKLVNNF